MPEEAPVTRAIWPASEVIAVIVNERRDGRARRWSESEIDECRKRCYPRASRFPDPSHRGKSSERRSEIELGASSSGSFRHGHDLARHDPVRIQRVLEILDDNWDGRARSRILCSVHSPYAQ